MVTFFAHNTSDSYLLSVPTNASAVSSYLESISIGFASNEITVSKLLFACWLHSKVDFFAM